MLLYCQDRTPETDSFQFIRISVVREEIIYLKFTQQLMNKE